MFKVGEIVNLFNSEGSWRILEAKTQQGCTVLELQGLLSKNILFENSEDVVKE